MHTLTLAAAVVLTAPAFAQEQSQKQAQVARDAIVARHLTPLIDAYEIPGAVVALYHDDKLTFHPIGTLNYDQDQAPTTETMYEIGSISKVITGTLFADAVRRGEVARDTPLSELVPDGVKVPAGEDGEPVLLWHLTTHTSGWGTVPINLMPTDPDIPFGGYTNDMLYSAIEDTRLQHTPGTHFEYSNFAVGVLGIVLADHANSDYETLTKQRIFAPLGIRDFTITLDADQQARLAPATKGGLNTKPWGSMGAVAPAGMWTTTAPQLITFAMENLRETDEDALEIYESLSMAREPLFKVESMGQQVCMGWFIAGDGKTRWHNGQTGGYSSYLGINREMDMAVVVLTNGSTFLTTLAGEKIFQQLAGMNPEPVSVARPEPISDELGQRLVGTYKSAMGFGIEIIIENTMMFARVTNQTFNRLHPVDKINEGEARFKYDVIDADLGFELPEGDGPAASVTLYQNGMEMKCARVEE